MINVAYAVSKDYEKYAAANLHSLAQIYDKINVLVVIDEGQGRIFQKVLRYNDAEGNITKIKPSNYDNLPTTDYFHTSCYYILDALHEGSKIFEKAFWFFDADTVVLRPLNHQCKKKGISGVRGGLASTHTDHIHEMVNTGVLHISEDYEMPEPRLIAEHTTIPRSIKESHRFAADQDLLNLSDIDLHTGLDPRYNPRGFMDNFAELLQEARVLHCSGMYGPWSYKSRYPSRELWREHYRQVPDSTFEHDDSYHRLKDWIHRALQWVLYELKFLAQK